MKSEAVFIQQIEAIFDGGVLRPLEPLALEDQQHVLIAVRTFEPAETIGARLAEQQWLNRHGHEYRGQWVAIQGDRLVSHGSKATAVLAAARRQGGERPILTQVPDDAGLPSSGWL